jgi:hypothetical protein
MSKKNQPQFDKDVELLKINILSDDLRSRFLTAFGLYLSLLVAFSTLIVSQFAFFSKPTLFSLIFLLAIGIVGAYAGNRAMFDFLRYKSQLSQISWLIKTVQYGSPIPDLDELLNRLKGTEKGSLLSRLKSFYAWIKRFAWILAVVNILTIGYGITNVYYGSDMNSASIYCISANNRNFPVSPGFPPALDYGKIDISVGLNRSSSFVAGLFENIQTTWRITLLINLPGQEWAYLNATNSPAVLGTSTKFNMTFDSTYFTTPWNITVDSISLTDTYSSVNGFFPLGVVHVNSKYLNLFLPFNATNAFLRIMKLRQLLIQNILLLSGLPIETIPHGCYGAY